MKTRILMWAEQQSRDCACDALKAGGVLVGTSDTVLGLLADVTQQGFNTLNAIKGRDQKPYVVLIASQQHVYYFVDEVSPLADKLMRACWPGPLTLIMKAKKDLAPYLGSPQGTIALRVPQHQGLLAILPNFKGLFSTSANLSGEPVPTSLEQIHPNLMQKISYSIMDTNQGSSHTLPSTIVDCSGDNIHIIREGAYSVHKLKAIMGTGIGDTAE